MSAGLAEIERAFTRMCLDAEPSDADLETLHGDPDRWRMYRGMVRSRLMGMLRMGLPKTAELLGEAFDAAASAYLAAHRPRNRFIRETVHELVDHALPGWEADPSMPPHLGDLVRWEATKWRVAAVDAAFPAADDLDYARPMVLNPTIEAMTVQHRVDKDFRAPARLAEPSLFLVYRRPNDPLLYTYVLNRIGGLLYEAWASGASGAEGTQRVLTALGRAPDAKFVDGMATILAEMVERQLVLGARVTGEAAPA